MTVRLTRVESFVKENLGKSFLDRQVGGDLIQSRVGQGVRSDLKQP